MRPGFLATASAVLASAAVRGQEQPGCGCTVLSQCDTEGIVNPGFQPAADAEKAITPWWPVTGTVEPGAGWELSSSSISLPRCLTPARYTPTQLGESQGLADAGELGMLMMKLQADLETNAD